MRNKLSLAPWRVHDDLRYYHRTFVLQRGLLNGDRRGELVCVGRYGIDLRQLADASVPMGKRKGQCQQQTSEERGCGDENITRHGL